MFIIVKVHKERRLKQCERNRSIEYTSIGITFDMKKKLERVRILLGLMPEKFAPDSFNSKWTYDDVLEFLITPVLMDLEKVAIKELYKITRE